MPVSEGLIKFSSSEKFLREVMREDAKLADLIPDDDKPASVLGKLRACVKAGGKINAYGDRVDLAIGRCLARAKADPEIWKLAGYKKFGDFAKAECEDKGISHGSCWNSKKIAEVFEGLPIEECVKNGGMTNLVTAAYALPPDASLKQKKEALADIKMPGEKFKREIEKKYSMDKGTTDYAEVQFEGNRAQANIVLEWLKNKTAQEVLGTAHPMGMLVALIESNATEFQDYEEYNNHTGEPPANDPAGDWL